jgi:isoleucyl-tRNA synthetase
MQAVSLGRNLRKQTRLRVRQPLRACILVSHNDTVRADLRDMAEIIADELNVKSVLVQANEEELVHLSAKPNLKRLGPKLGKRMRALAPALAALDGKAIARLRAGQTLDLELGDGGPPVTIGEDDVLVLREEREGMTVANEGDITVAIETTLDEDLLREGWARELVSKLQGLRKDANLEVDERIRVECRLPAEAAAAVAHHGDFIRNEILAAELTIGEAADGTEVLVNDLPCRFRIAKMN